MDLGDGGCKGFLEAPKESTLVLRKDQQVSGMEICSELSPWYGVRPSQKPNSGALVESSRDCKALIPLPLRALVVRGDIVINEYQGLLECLPALRRSIKPVIRATLVARELEEAGRREALSFRLLNRHHTCPWGNWEPGPMNKPVTTQ